MLSVDAVVVVSAGLLRALLTRARRLRLGGQATRLQALPAQAMRLRHRLIMNLVLFWFGDLLASAIARGPLTSEAMAVRDEVCPEHESDCCT